MNKTRRSDSPATVHVSAAGSAPDADEAPVGDESPRVQRSLAGFYGYVVSGFAILFAFYYLLAGIRGPDSPQFHRGFFVGGGAVLVLLVYPALKNRRTSRWVLAFDVTLAAAAAATFGYFVTQFGEMARRSGAPSELDTVMGIVAVVISIELARRTTGWALAIIAIVMIAYVFVGPYMPGLLRHGSFSLDRFISMAYPSFNGLFGVVASAFADFVFLFIVFGAFLSKSGAARFFADLPFALAGHRRGGPAKVSVMMSGALGSLSGSAVANVMTTGVFTIPAMLRSGYRREFAGGVEAAASSGGGILPPVMGAGAFLIAEFSGIPYSEIVLVSIVPAIMYFAGVYFQVDLEALKHDLPGLPKDELPNAKSVLKDGWYLVLPLVVVFVLIMQNFSPAYAGFWGTISTIAIGMAFPYAGRRMTVRDNVDALREAALRALPVVAIVGVLGIIIAVMNLTGLGLRFGDLIVGASGGQLLVMMIFLVFAAWVLGAGLTVTSAYVILAVIAVPALQEVGVGLLAAHLIIFWISQDITPPVCVPAFAAASIAGGSMMGTGWQAWKLARALYIVPFLMAFGGLVDGSAEDVVHSAIAGTIGIFFFATASTGYFIARLSVLSRIVMLVASGMLLHPEYIVNAVGIVMGIGVYAFMRAQKKRQEGTGAGHSTDSGVEASKVVDEDRS